MVKIHSMMLQGQRVRLRPIRVGDAKLLTQWFSYPEVARFIEHRNISLAEARKLIRERLKSKNFKKYIIVVNRVPIGTAELQIFPKDRYANIASFVIGERRFRGKGYGSESMSILIQYALHRLKLHRVQLIVHEDNTAAQHLYKKFGFTFEGRARERVLRSGKYYDARYMGLLEHEWKKKRGKKHLP